MGTYDDDDDIEFDFFDEPATVEATERRRRPRLEMPGGSRRGDRPPRPPFRTPTGLVPLARLVGLVAIAIAIVVGLVFWVGSCQGKSRHDEYASYSDKVRAIASADKRLGAKLTAKLTQQDVKQAELEASLQQYAQQEQQAYTQAQQIRAPGPLRTYHQNMVDSVELRAKGLAGLADTLARAGVKKDQAATAAELTTQAQQLTASDVVWEQLYRQPATQQLVDEGVKGVVIPASHFVTTPDVVSVRAFTGLLGRLGGASTGGTPSGLHGDGIASVKVTPQGSQLSTSSPTVVKVSSDLAFEVAVENSGDFQETSVPVTLTITAGGKQIAKKSKTITLIGSHETKTVSFSGFDVPPSAFNTKPTVKVVVGKVPGERNLDNNSASYPIFFTLS